jgi:hypothetical protein
VHARNPFVAKQLQNDELQHGRNCCQQLIAAPRPADEDLSAEIEAALAEIAPTVAVKRTVHPYAFAVPVGVMRSEGRSCGATEIMAPWGDTSLEESFTAR